MTKKEPSLIEEFIGSDLPRERHFAEVLLRSETFKGGVTPDYEALQKHVKASLADYLHQKARDLDPDIQYAVEESLDHWSYSAIALLVGEAHYGEIWSAFVLYNIRMKGSFADAGIKMDLPIIVLPDGSLAIVGGNLERGESDLVDAIRMIVRMYKGQGESPNGTVQDQADEQVIQALRSIRRRMSGGRNQHD